MESRRVEIGQKEEKAILGHFRWLHQIAVQPPIHPLWYRDVDVFWG